MKCAYCRKDFTREDAEAACGQCGLFGGCHLVKCPYCGAEQPEEPRMVGWLRNRLQRRHRHGRQIHTAPPGQTETSPVMPSVLPLSALAVGEAGFISELRLPDDDTSRKLMALGLLPGVRVKVVQRQPMTVVQVVFSQIALDRTLASAIWVHPDIES